MSGITPWGSERVDRGQFFHPVEIHVQILKRRGFSWHDFLELVDYLEVLVQGVDITYREVIKVLLLL